MKSFPGMFLFPGIFTVVAILMLVGAGFTVTGRSIDRREVVTASYTLMNVMVNDPKFASVHDLIRDAMSDDNRVTKCEFRAIHNAYNTINNNKEKARLSKSLDASQ